MWPRKRKNTISKSIDTREAVLMIGRLHGKESEKTKTENVSVKLDRISVI